MFKNNNLLKTEGKKTKNKNKFSSKFVLFKEKTFTNKFLRTFLKVIVKDV